MAVKQIILQDNVDSISKRVIIQYSTDGTNQLIINYDNLTVQEKVAYDALLEVLSLRQ